MRERRALLTSVRRAIFRVAFLADLVWAIRVPSWSARLRAGHAAAAAHAKKQRRRAGARRLTGRLIGQARRRRQRLPERTLLVGAWPDRRTGTTLGSSPRACFAGILI